MWHPVHVHVTSPVFKSQPVISSGHFLAATVLSREGLADLVVSRFSGFRVM
jgi:hypothetical protein